MEQHRHTKLRFTQCQLNLEKRHKFKGERTVFSTNGVGTTVHAYTKEMNVDTEIAPFIKINSR